MQQDIIRQFPREEQERAAALLAGKSARSLELLQAFIHTCQEHAGDNITLRATRSVICIGRACIIQLAKQFIDIVFPFPVAHEDNLCFRKIAKVPGSNQYNHHLRIMDKSDLNEETIKYILLLENYTKK